MLLAGLWRSSRDLVGAGFTGLVLVAILTIPAYKTGGKTARLIHAIPGVMRQNIHEHAEAADDAFTASGSSGRFVSGGPVAEFPARSDRPNCSRFLSFLARWPCPSGLDGVAHLGGLIRHPEIAADFQPPQ